MPGIVVVGAGPTGLTVACELYRRGLPCRVVAKAGAPTEHTRALGMFTRSLEVLHGFGAADEAIARGHPIEVASIYSSRRRVGGLTATSLVGTRRATLLCLPQCETEVLLEDRLAALGGTVERETSLRTLRHTPGRDGVQLTLDGPGGEEEVEADWVVGADGAHSVVRKSLGIEFAGEPTDHVFVIVDTDLATGPRRAETHYYFSPDGVTVVVPLPNGSYRIAAGMRDFIGDGSPVSLAAVQEILDRRLGQGVRLRELFDAGWGAAQVRPQARIAERFRDGRCILAGDAAHIYSPIGGQGMNGGIQDAHNLAWKLALVSSGRAKESLLDSYAIERRAISERARKATEVQMKVGGTRSRAGIAARDRFVATATRVPPLAREMAAEAVMLNHRYPESPAVAPSGRRAPEGRRIPDGPLGDQVGGAQMLFDVLRERPFTVLALGATDRDLPAIDELARLLDERYGELAAVRCLEDGGSGTRLDRSGTLIDRNGDLHRHLRVREPSVCLVRTDSHIAMQRPLAAAGAVVELLGRVLEPQPAQVMPAVT